MRGKDLVDQVRGASSRGQKGRGCQLDCSSDPNSSNPHREGCLTPCRLVIEAHRMLEGGGGTGNMELFGGCKEAWGWKMNGGGGVGRRVNE